MCLKLKCVLIILLKISGLTIANPDAKRLYDDLLSTYNRLIRPVSNNTDTVLVKLGLRLSQLIDLVSLITKIIVNYICWINSYRWFCGWFLHICLVSPFSLNDEGFDFDKGYVSI